MIQQLINEQVHIDAYKQQMKIKSDKLMDYFLFCFFICGLLLSFFYETWTIGFGVGGLSLIAYYSTKKILPKSDFYQYVLGAVYGVFMAQYIYQMHGMFEMHFIAFIGSAILITYQNWKLQIPLALVVIIHHALFGYMQYIGLKDVYFTQLVYMDIQTFIIHGTLATVVFFICGLWAYNIKKYSERHIDLASRITRFQEVELQKEKSVQNERLLSEAQKLAKMGNWDANLIKNEIFWSEGTRANYGVDADYEPSLNAYLSFIHPGDRDKVASLIQNAMQTGESIAYECRIIRHLDKQMRWLHAQIWVALDKNGQAVRMFGISQDITERKYAERETVDLVDNLQRKNKDLHMFAFMVSHNLRAPIAKILGMASIFKFKPEHQELLIDKIANEVNNLDLVVRDMNEIITARDVKNKESEYITFCEKLNLIKQVLENEITGANATITDDFNEVMGVTAIRSYLYSIMYNLLSNAIKYRRPEAPLNIHFQTCLQGQYTRLSVTDNGIGINLDKFGEKLFGLYNRFHTGDVPGRGIGLNLVKTQVEAMGGKIEVESQPGKGTAFHVFLPNN